MTRFWLKPILILTILFTTSSLATCVLGSTQPPVPALRGFIEGCEGKTQPCWYGIQPGITKPNDAIQLLESVGYKRTRAGYSSDFFERTEGTFFNDVHLEIGFNNRILSIELKNGIHPPQLGETLILTGLPKYITASQSFTHLECFQSCVVGHFPHVPDPTHPVERITLYGSDPSSHRRNWHGFAPYWRYCHLEPTYGYC